MFPILKLPLLHTITNKPIIFNQIKEKYPLGHSNKHNLQCCMQHKQVEREDPVGEGHVM